MKFISALLLASGLTLCACATDSTKEITGSSSHQTKTSLTKDGDQYTASTPIPSFSDYILIKTGLGEKNAKPRIVNLGEMIDDLARYDVVFVGEAHGHAANHYLQSKILAGLYRHHPDMALSMEQFERSQQKVVDDYLAGKIGEETLVHDGKAWSHYRQSYRPLVEFAKRHHLPVIAAEVPGNMVSCVGERGPDFIKTLKGEPRKWIARELHTGDGPYKDKFYTFLDQAAGHSVSDPNASEEEKARKKFYRFSAQVARDDTMAESIADYLRAHPGHRVMHINGHFHSEGLLGTVERLKMRMPDVSVANVAPILVGDPEHPQFSEEDLRAGQYLMLLYPVPRRFVQMKNINAFIKRTKSKIDENRCAY